MIDSDMTFRYWKLNPGLSSGRRTTGMVPYYLIWLSSVACLNED